MKKAPVFKFKPFSRKQRQVMNWWMDGSPVKDYDGIIADGSIRAGKTIAMSLGFVFWAMECFDGQNFIMAGKTIGSFQRNVLTNLKTMLRSRGYYCNHHISGETPNMLEISRKGRTNYFYIFGGKDEGSQELVQGITAAGAFFDEVALMPESFVNQATGRCSVSNSKFWFNCNPAGPIHWFKTGWIDNAGKRHILHIHFTMDDNLSLSPEIKDRYKKQYSGVFYQRFILGLWTAADGIIYDMFSVENNCVNVEKISVEYSAKHLGASFFMAKSFVSCDYGTQNATVFLLWQKAVNGIWYVTKEYYYSGRDRHVQKTDVEFSTDLKDWLGEQAIQYVIVDPAAASFKVQLRKDGFIVLDADNDVLDGIRTTATWLYTGKVYISERCENTIKEFQSYQWDPKAAQRGEDKPLKVMDHAMDALRYGIKHIASGIITAETGRI